MDEYDVRRIARDVMHEWHKHKYCPECRELTPMVGVSWDEDTEEETYRCFGCLGLFTEKLVMKAHINQNVPLEG